VYQQMLSSGKFQEQAGRLHATIGLLKTLDESAKVVTKEQMNLLQHRLKIAAQQILFQMKPIFYRFNRQQQKKCLHHFLYIHAMLQTRLPSDKIIRALGFYKPQKLAVLSRSLCQTIAKIADNLIRKSLLEQALNRYSKGLSHDDL
jgi:hypothetical protein